MGKGFYIQEWPSSERVMLVEHQQLLRILTFYYACAIIVKLRYNKNMNQRLNPKPEEVVNDYNNAVYDYERLHNLETNRNMKNDATRFLGAILVGKAHLQQLTEARDHLAVMDGYSKRYAEKNLPALKAQAKREMEVHLSEYDTAEEG